jgi:hypothetical protein
MNHKTKAKRDSQTALIDAASAEYLEKIEERELNRRHVEGYLRAPENPSLGEAGGRLAAQVWPVERWDETGGLYKAAAAGKTGKRLILQKKSEDLRTYPECC